MNISQETRAPAIHRLTNYRHPELVQKLASHYNASVEKVESSLDMADELALAGQHNGQSDL